MEVTKAESPLLEDLNKDQPITIAFNNLCYFVEQEIRPLSLYEKWSGLTLEGFPRGEVTQKHLLTDVTGSIKPGTMTALMGPSGAGKSTLLDVLAGRKNSGFTTGEILYNGKERSPDFRRIIGYVEQTDTLLPTLTPREILYFTARMKLPSCTSEEVINAKVTEVLTELGLLKCADTLIGDAHRRGISGGQAKRVNIGIELVTDPRVLFLDEPTTGLDSSTTLEVMSVIRSISRRGRTVIATIHQPSTDAFALFDKLLLLVSGEVVFLGNADSAVRYFEKFGFKYPPGSNPAEFLVTVTDPIPRAVQRVEGPKVHSRFFAEEYVKSSLSRDRLQSTMSAMRKTSLVASSQQRPHLIANNRFYNCKILIRRFSTMRIRDGPFLMSRFAKIIFISFILSSLFYDQPKTSKGVYNIMSILNFSVMNFAFGAMAFMGMMIHERKFFEREQASATYQISSYYLATFFSELPYTLAQVFIFSIINYWAVGLRASASGFFTYCLIIFLLCDLGIGLASFFSSISSDTQKANSMAFPVLIVSFLFAGFFVRKQMIPVYWIWAYYISFINYGLNSIALNQFDGSNSYVATTGQTDDEILAYWGFGPSAGISDLWKNVLVLFLLWCFWRFVPYLGLLHSGGSAR